MTALSSVSRKAQKGLAGNLSSPTPTLNVATSRPVTPVTYSFMGYTHLPEGSYYLTVEN